VTTEGEEERGEGTGECSRVVAIGVLGVMACWTWGGRGEGCGEGVVETIEKVSDWSRVVCVNAALLLLLVEDTAEDTTGTAVVFTC